MDNYPGKSNILLRRTVVYIFICATCLGLLSASFEFYTIYNQEIKRINDNLEQIERTQLETLANSVWLLNNDSIQIQFQSLLQHPDIIYLEFADTHNKSKIIAGKKPVTLDSIISKTIPLHFVDDGKDILLGTFSLQVSIEATKKMLYRRLPLIALSESFKIIMLCGLIIWIIHSLFSRHLSQIARFTNALDIDQLHNRLMLERKEKDASETDELSQIVKAINEMLDRIKEGLRQKEQVETTLRKNEELLLFAAEGASLGVWDWNLETNETYFNSIYFTMLGYEADEFSHSYETWRELMHPDDRNMVADEIKRCLSLDSPWRIEFRLQTRKEGYKWVLGSGKVVERDETGRPLRATGIHLDISVSKSLEEERQKVINLESVGVLAGGIAHDFNNILAAILGNVELASHRIENDVKTTSLLVDAQKATRRAAKLTQQLLTFAKGGDPVKETTSLCELVRDSADFVLHGSSVACKYDFSDGLWLVDVDTGQLGQVIQNITLNAMHAMPEGGELEIACKNVEDVAAETLLSAHEGNFVTITIKDSGTGIPLETQDKIFDPYYTTKREGSGLGLAICHSIISKHDGHIAVQSVEGKGTTFSIYLPAATSTDTVTCKEKKSKTVVSTISVMVMDDDEMIREMTQEQLSILGHDVLLVVDGEQAINTFKELLDSNMPPDLVIMDLTIPGGMGGQEAARKLLQIAPGTKIIVASGYSNNPVMANYQKYGFSAAITKPFGLDELKTGIETALT